MSYNYSPPRPRSYIKGPRNTTFTQGSGRRFAETQYAQRGIVVPYQSPRLPSAEDEFIDYLHTPSVGFITLARIFSPLINHPQAKNRIVQYLIDTFPSPDDETFNEQASDFINEVLLRVPGSVNIVTPEQAQSLYNRLLDYSGFYEMPLEDQWWHV